MDFPRIPLTDTDREMDAMFGERAWIVGGRIRDEFFAAQRGEKIASKDHDYLVTGRTYEQIVAILRNAGWHADLVGDSFGVVKGRKGDLEVDVAMPRKERSTGQGHKDFEIEFGAHISVEEDLERRDITWGAGAVNVRTGEVKGNPQTLNDLETRTIRVISPNSIPEDPLRMLRIIQFAARFDGVVEPYTREQIQKHAGLIAGVAAERVQEELDKMMLRSRTPSSGWRLMQQLGLLEHIAPEYVPAVGLKQNTYHDLDVWGHDLKATDRAAQTIREGGLDAALRTGNLDEATLAKVLVYGAFMHDIGKPETANWVDDEYGNSFHGHESVGAAIARRTLARWKFSEFESEAISGLVKHHMYAHQQIMRDGLVDGAGTNRAIRRLLRSAAETQPMAVETWWEVQFLVRQCDVLGGKKTAVWHVNDTNHEFYRQVHEVLTHIPALAVKDLNIDGPTVIAAFIEAGWENEKFAGGRSVSTCLKACLDAVVDNPECNNPENLLEIVKAEASARYYISEPDKAKGSTVDLPHLLHVQVEKEETIAHVGYVESDRDDGVVQGGFVRIEKNGETTAEMRGLDMRRMTTCLEKMHADKEQAAVVLAAMANKTAEPPPLSFEAHGHLVKVDGLFTERRILEIVKPDGTLIERGGIPNAENLDALIGPGPASDEIIQKLREIDLYGAKARSATKKTLANWPSREIVGATKGR